MDAYAIFNISQLALLVLFTVEVALLPRMLARPLRLRTMTNTRFLRYALVATAVVVALHIVGLFVVPAPSDKWFFFRVDAILYWAVVLPAGSYLLWRFAPRFTRPRNAAVPTGPMPESSRLD